MGIDIVPQTCHMMPAPESCLDYAVVSASITDRTEINPNGPGRPRITTERPWDIQGISRSTYYERLKPTIPAKISYATDTLRWFCVRTEYDREVKVDTTLRNTGFQTFYPMIWVAPRPAHRTENGRAVPARSERLAPLFPRYLFVQFLRSDPSWRRIVTMRGVAGLFSTSPENPTAVPDSAIERIRAICAPNGAVYPDDISPCIPAGQSVRIIAGPFADRTVICRWSDHERVEFLMTLFGAERQMSVARADVEVV